jgi:GNAT superfamily N-acetyltransferase
MIEYRTLLPPYDPDVLEQIQVLGLEIFGRLERDEVAWRLKHMPDPSVHVASEAQVIGFKLGYASASDRYHSWLGGVREGWRRKGVALQLMHRQHDWLRSRGYVSVETATVPDNVAMFSLNLRAGFRVIGSYCRGDHLRVTLAKDLRG